MDQQNVAYSHKGILFNSKKEWSTNGCYKVDEPGKHGAKWKKTDTKGHMLYDSINIKNPEEANP